MLQLVIGPMYSGKTTFLLDKLSQMPDNSLYINHSFDTRGEIFYSHNKNVKNVVNAIKTDILTDDMIEKYSIIGIDESQFFTNLAETVKRWVEKLGKIVYITGLNGDYKREIFGEIYKLLSFCDNVTQLHAVCLCGKNALFSYRKTGETDKILIGTTEYVALCRECYLKRNN